MATHLTQQTDWVTEHIKPGSSWRWHSPDGNCDVIVVVEGYRSTAGRESFAYDIELSGFFVMQQGKAVASFPDGPVGLPAWFVTALLPASGHIPYHINSDAFQQLAEEGALVQM